MIKIKVKEEEEVACDRTGKRRGMETGQYLNDLVKSKLAEVKGHVEFESERIRGQGQV
jgi:hypothetical protein